VKPLVTIGLPVYNAASTLSRALESLVAQDYPNIEIIISDNASTDSTADICRSCAARDSRVVYVRQPQNRGPVWNFNHVVGLANGKYFVRMSHDDIRSAEYLTRCVALLEANPDAVLSHSYTAAFYGDPSNVLCILTHDTVVGMKNPRKRFMRALRHLPASAVDGVFRTDVLRQKTRLMEPYLSSDIVLTHELSLHGEFVQVPEVLFWRSGKTILPPPQDVLRWSGQPTRISRLAPPVAVLVLNHLRSIRRSPLTLLGKAVLSLQLLAHECRTAAVKVGFRALTTAAGDRCPTWLLRRLIALAGENPNVRVLKHPRELPPALHPTWRLLNHRNMEKALRLQQKLDAKLYPSRA
jgi:glycosyltransferase involved in cell wall biosynthesis